MPELEILGERAETPEEQQIRAWFITQALGSADTLDAAARTLIGLVTGLVGVLFGVLTIAAEAAKQPAYLALESVRWLGVISVAALLAALLCALNVVLPRQVPFHVNRPDEQREALEALLRQKRRWLSRATAGFALGLTGLTALLVVALLHR